MADQRDSACPWRFTTTIWSQIDVAADSQHPGHHAAVEHLLRQYWKPVFYFIRARGRSLEEAEDLTQEFFFRICDRGWLQAADPQRGRFRTFLLTLLTRFLSDQSGRRVRRQVQFEASAVSMSQLLQKDDRAYEPAGSQSAESIYFEKWIGMVLLRACKVVRDEYQREGRESWYAAFEGCSLREPQERLRQHEVAMQLTMTRDQVRYALSHVQERLQRRLKEELQLDGCPLQELESELGALFATLSKGTADKAIASQVVK